MKKIIKIFLIVLSISFLLINLNYAYAGDFNPYTYDPGQYANIDNEVVINYSNKFTGFLTTVAVIVAVIALMILGLKFILASTTGKAEYKQHLVPVMIGLAIVAFIGALVSIFANLGDEINNQTPTVTVESQKSSNINFIDDNNQTMALKKYYFKGGVVV